MQDTEAFCRSTLCHPEVTQWLDAMLICWGGNIRYHSAFDVSAVALLYCTCACAHRLVAAQSCSCCEAAMPALLSRPFVQSHPCKAINQAFAAGRETTGSDVSLHCTAGEPGLTGTQFCCSRSRAVTPVSVRTVSRACRMPGGAVSVGLGATPRWQAGHGAPACELAHVSLN